MPRRLRPPRSSAACIVPDAQDPRARRLCRTARADRVRCLHQAGRAGHLCLWFLENSASAAQCWERRARHLLPRAPVRRRCARAVRHHAAGVATTHFGAAHRPRRRRRAQVTAEHLHVRLPIPAHRLRAAATPSPTTPWIPSSGHDSPRWLLGSTRPAGTVAPASTVNQWARQPPAAAYNSPRRQLTGSSVNYPVNGGSSRCDGGGVHSVLFLSSNHVCRYT